MSVLNKISTFLTIPRGSSWCDKAYNTSLITSGIHSAHVSTFSLTMSKKWYEYEHEHEILFNIIPGNKFK